MNLKPRNTCHLFLLFASLLLAGASSNLQAAPAGKVVFAKGAASVQSTAGGLRFVGAGDPLETGDVLSTGAKSFAVLELADQSRVVLRPDTRFAVTAFDTTPGKENALFDLFQGGLRAVTGFLNKKRPGSVSVRSATATIGIRGTDFAARVCSDDCADPLKQAQQSSQINQTESPVVARVVVTAGKAERVEADGSRYPLIKGSPLYAGSVIETGRPGLAVLVFRDDTRISLAPSTQFVVERFQEKDIAATESTASTTAAAALEPGVWLKLIRGGLRAVTGAVARARPTSFRLATPVGTIGVRGTGFDLQYPGDCGKGGGGKGGKEALAAGVWNGSITVQESGNAEIKEGKSGCVNELGGAITETREGPRIEAPRPDEVEVPEDLFTAETRAGSERGLHVSVFDGQVVISSDSGEITLGRGEDGLAGGGSNNPVRYESFTPVARVDVFSGIDPIGNAGDWDSIDPTSAGGAMCAP
jgi:hypothetical protein